MLILPNPLPPDAQRVLSQYPPMLAQARWEPITGGFSGARVWHGIASDGSEYALKAHPTSRLTADVLTTIHRWMDTLRGWRGTMLMPDVPVVQRTSHGVTLVEEQGSVWEVLSWLPGIADFHANPSSMRLFGAVHLLGAMHRRWARFRTRLPQPIPAIRRRWQALQTWQRLLEQGWQPCVQAGDALHSLASRAWSQLPTHVARSVLRLQPWREREAHLQPCLCDLWHDNVLFTGERVTGIIDYAAMKYDHPAVDIARLLGSLLPVGDERYETALERFRSETDLDQPELVPLLDETGTVVAVTNWLRWLYHEQRSFPNRNALAERLQWLVTRLEATA